MNQELLKGLTEEQIAKAKACKNSNEVLAKDKSAMYDIQKEKYENQLKIKDETIKKLQEYINKQNKIKNEDNKNFLDLNEQLKNMKEKYEIQNKNMKNIEERYKEQNQKNIKRNANTGRYVINDYLNKLGQFANGLYNINSEDEDE